MILREMETEELRDFCNKEYNGDKDKGEVLFNEIVSLREKMKANAKKVVN